MKNEHILEENVEQLPTNNEQWTIIEQPAQKKQKYVTMERLSEERDPTVNSRHVQVKNE